MRLRELLDELEALVEEVGDDADVRLAQQPRWAFEYSIDGVVGVPASKREQGRTGAAGIVYLGEGTQLGYLPGPAAVALGWSEASADEDEDDEEDEDPDDDEGEDSPAGGDQVEARKGGGR